MSNSVPVSIKLTAVDAVTAKVSAINARLSKIVAPVTQYQTAFSNLSKEMGLERVGVSLSKVGSTSANFFNDLFGGASRAGLAIAAAGGSLFALTNSFAQSGNEIENVSKRLGMSTDAFQELSFAFKMADISQEEFVAGMTKLQRGMVETRMGTGEAMPVFQAFGISMKTSSGRVKKAEEILGEFSDAMAKTKDESLRTKAVMAVFGRGGAPLLNLFSKGSKGIQEFREQAKKIGAVMDKEQIANASKFDDGLKSIGATLLGVRNIIGAALAPAILKLGEKFQAFLLKNEPEIKRLSELFADALPKAFDKAGTFFLSLSEKSQPLINIFTKLVDIFGAANVALGLFVATFFGPAIVSFIKMGAAIFGVISPLGRLVYQLGALASGPLLAAFRLAFAASPIALAITAVAALSTGVYLLWKNWDSVLDKMSSAWNFMKRFLGFSPGSVVGPIQGPTRDGTPLGAPIGAQAVGVTAAKGSVNRTENQIEVRFENMPTGTRVEAIKSEIPIDLFSGYSSAGRD